MTPPRFQFTIKGLLWVTFWPAVATAVCWYPDRFSIGRVSFGIHKNESYEFNTSHFASLAAIVCLCAGAGALIGQHLKGLLAGIVMVTGVVAWVTLYWLIERI